MRALWASQAFLLGPLLSEALDSTSPSYRTSVSIALWAIWALTLVASLVPHPMTLTEIRIVIPASVPVAIWAAIVADSPGWAVAGVTVAVLSTAAAMHPVVGAIFVDGASYGDERRLPLRAPALLLLAPIPMAWLTTLIGMTLGPLLLAAEQWIAGAIITAIGVPLALLTARSLHGLATRWIVFVPAGLVLHDALVLADPVLFRRQIVEQIGPALADTDATDLTAAATGLALQVNLETEAEIRQGEAVAEISAFLFTPSLPGAVLQEARKRRLPVG
jgi:hypothetical protein